MGIADLKQVSRDQPTLVESLLHYVPKQLSAGGHHSACVTENGMLFTWGSAESGPLGLGEHVVLPVSSPQLVSFPEGEHVRIDKVDCGSKHTLALDLNGMVLSTGAGEFG